MTFRVRFDESAFAEDLEHASTTGKEVAAMARARLEQDGVAPHELLRCQSEGRDGTRLLGCVKTYLPQPAGDWGMVFQAGQDAQGRFTLVFLAFGVRHPVRPWQPSVYRVADRRLNRESG